MRPLVALSLVAVLGASACTGDKVLAARRALATDPAKAIALLQQADQERSPCFDCQVYLGFAYERTGDLNAAITAYEKAVAMPDAATRPEPVAARLLEAYEKQYLAATAPDVRLDIARRAAPLEAPLKVARPWANQALGAALDKDLQAAKTAGKAPEALKAAQAIGALYLPAEQKRQAAADATEALKTVWARKASEAFKEKAAGDLADAGLYDPTKGEITLSYTFKVPTAKDDAAFDPKGPDFKANLRKAACTPLRDALAKVVEKAAPAMGAKTPGEQDLNRLFAQLFSRNATAGYGVFGADKRANPAGLPYVCALRLSLADFAGELFRFTE